MRTWRFYLLFAVFLLGACAPQSFLPQTNADSRTPLVSTLEAAVVVEPENSAAYYNLGLAYAAVRRYQEALQAWEQALRLDTASLPLSDVFYAMGNAHFELSDYQAAISAYRQALLQNPDNDNARYNLELAALKLSSVSIALPSPTNTLTPTPTPESSANSSAEMTSVVIQGLDTSASIQLDDDPAMNEDEAQRVLDTVLQYQRSLNLAQTPAPSQGNRRDW